MSKYVCVCKYAIGCNYKNYNGCNNCVYSDFYRKIEYDVVEGVLIPVGETPLVEILKKKGRYT